jgi:hypothetical protein
VSRRAVPFFQCQTPPLLEARVGWPFPFSNIRPLPRLKRESEGFFSILLHHTDPSLAQNMRRRGFFFTYYTSVTSFLLPGLKRESEGHFLFFNTRPLPCLKHETEEVFSACNAPPLSPPSLKTRVGVQRQTPRTLARKVRRRGFSFFLYLLHHHRSLSRSNTQVRGVLFFFQLTTPDPSLARYARRKVLFSFFLHFLQHQ